MLTKQAQVTHKETFKAIHRSQHCQRNWDLTQLMPHNDVEILVEAASQCPSKQNAAYYRVHVFTNREKIEGIHSYTRGFGINKETITTNSQMLANLVIVFESTDLKPEINRIRQNYMMLTQDATIEQIKQEVARDQHMAVGIAAGYLNLLSSQLGYGTGCCACFDPAGLKEYLSFDNDIVLMMGIGFPGAKNRRIHHLDENIKFPTKTKQVIDVVYHN